MKRSKRWSRSTPVWLAACFTSLVSAPTVAALEGEVTIVTCADAIPLPAAKDEILVSAGGALRAASEAGRSIEAAFPDLAAAASTRILNLGTPDVKGEGLGLARAAAGRGVPVLGSNLRSAPDAKDVVKRSVVVESGGFHLAFVGVSDPDPLQAAEAFPFQDVEAALVRELGSVPADVAAVVLVAYMDPVRAAELQRRFPRVCLALVGGNTPTAGPDPVRVGENQYLVTVPKGGGPRARTTIRFEASGAPRDVENRWTMAPPPQDWPQSAVEVFRKHGLVLEPLKELLEKAEPPDRLEAPAAVPTSLEEGRPVALRIRAGNRGAECTLHTATLEPRYRDLRPTQGSAFLILDSEWENIIPLTTVYERKIPTAYRIPNLGDHLYLVVNGKAVSRLRSQADALPGQLPVKDFELERIGSRLRGNLLFEVPLEGLRTLELRFYDYAHGHFTARILNTPEGESVEEPKPAVAPVKNQFIELSVYRHERVKTLGGNTAPEGMTFLSVDARARSLFTVEADASAFDPKAAKKAKIRMGNVLDWNEALRHIQLVADGEYGYAPRRESTLPDSPRFLPDLMTGGDLVFLLPEGSSSLELRCEFPNASVPGAQETLRPRGISLILEGKRPRLLEPKSIASVEDGVFGVRVVGQKVAREFAGERAGDGRKFLVLDVTVKNGGKGCEFFQTREQLKYATEGGEQLEVDGATFGGARYPSELVMIPQGERRSFQVAYRIPESEKRPRLAYAGVTLAQVVSLAEIEAGAPLAKAESRESPDAPPPPVPAEAPPPEPEVEPTAPMKEEPVPEPEPVVTDVRRKERTEGRTPAKAPERVSARQDRAPQGLEGVGLTPERVNEAIDRGMRALWALLEKEIQPGRPLGWHEEHYIACLALIHADAHKKLPEFDARLRAFLAGAKPWDDRTYATGIFAMIVEGYGDPSFLPQLRRAARYLVEGQGPRGSWGYGNPADEELLRDPAEDRVLQVSGGFPPDAPPLAVEEMTRLTDWTKGGDGDNSCSQFALLGLHAASRSGVRLASEIWSRNLTESRKRQDEKDGGWGYTNGSSYGSMTCAGICALAICRHELGEADPAADEGIERGLAWLSGHFSLTENPKGSSWHLYYLYSLERVGRILDTEFIGEHEWYPLGARELLSTQQADGRWVGEDEEKDPRLATSFALLFLTRATPTLKVEPKRGGNGILKTGMRLSRSSRFYVILDASGSMLEVKEGRQKFEVAREALAGLIADLPAGSEVALRVYGHRKRAIEAGANEDTALEIPMEELKADEFLAKLNSLRARGKTPLARSLLEAAEDLSRASDERPVTVVLLTDGGEDTLPRQDPVKAAEEFGKLKGVTLHVVGFDIGREDWSEQLREISARAGGNYWPASRAEDLRRELRTAVLGIPEQFVVLDADRREVEKGAFGESKVLAEGKYYFKTTFGGQEFVEEFWVNTEAVTAVSFDAQKIAASETPASQVGSPPVAPEATSPGSQAEPAKTEPQPTARFCTQCGKPVKAGDKFCTSCGGKLQN